MVAQALGTTKSITRIPHKIYGTYQEEIYEMECRGGYANLGRILGENAPAVDVLFCFLVQILSILGYCEKIVLLSSFHVLYDAIKDDLCG